jgi:probable F420-dependent oxidoreductase
MRHGILLANIGTYADPRTVAEVAEAAETAGWEALLIWDHLGFVWGPPAADPWVALAAAVASTDRILLGTGITPVPRRRPHVLAHQVATLDVLSSGRVIFGAGIGGVPREFSAFGEPDDARLRAEMLDEGLDLLRALWTRDEVTHQGRHYTVEGVTLRPRPLQERLPIWIGGNSPPALRRAARFDGWFADTSGPEAMTVAPDELEGMLATIRAARTAADPFDVAVHGFSESGNAEIPSSFAEAGATWWLEDVHDRRGSAEAMLARVKAGPPT